MITINNKITSAVRFYSSVISSNISVFVALGFMSLLFSESGFFPNPALEGIKDNIYQYFIPSLLAFSASRKSGSIYSSIIAALMGICIGSSGYSFSSISVSIILGYITGRTADKIIDYFKKSEPEKFEMVYRNIVLGVLFVSAICIVYFIIAPISSTLDEIFSWLVSHTFTLKMLPIFTSIIEIGKVFFLNNSINHGILVPAAMTSVSESGKSALFLLESNPGPGFGMLFACFLYFREKRSFYSSCMTVQAIGGIHEIYFPVIMSHLYLFPALIIGGITGNYLFYLLDVGAFGTVSPGSVITMFMMCPSSDWFNLFISILRSAFSSYIVSYAILLIKNRGINIRDLISPENKNIEPKDSEIILPDYVEDIVFVCDAGMGSSVLAASIFRKKLKENNLSGIDVSACPLDNISEDADLIICQKGLVSRIDKLSEYATVIEMDSFMNMEKYDEIIDSIRKGG